MATEQRQPGKTVVRMLEVADEDEFVIFESKQGSYQNTGGNEHKKRSDLQGCTAPTNT